MYVNSIIHNQMCNQTNTTPKTEHKKHSEYTQTWLPGSKRFAYENILPSGDEIVNRMPNDNIFRVASNNIAGSKLGKYGLKVALDIKVTYDFGIDVMALQETKRPWNSPNRQAYEVQAKSMWPMGATSVFSSAPWRYDEEDYQAGGTLLMTHSNTIGRIVERGSDQWGRFSWMTLRGGRDEGILVVSAYRTPHRKNDKPGPFTAFTTQYESLRKLGVKDPDPRQRILDDLTRLIEEKRSTGFRPIIAMDANEDWVMNSHSNDREKLKKFIERNQLSDPYFEKFKEVPRTYTRGPWRLDYIFIDNALRGAIKRVGYLGSHDGNFSDHTLAYIDFHSNTLFRGLVNRPVEIHSREFMIEQTDKMLAFTCILRRLQNEHKIKERVFDLARCFVEHGPIQCNIRKYQKIDTEHRELILCAAAQAGHKKYGYMRSRV